MCRDGAEWMLIRSSRHIADKYWPLPVTETTHIRVQEMYRNALFREVVRRTREETIHKEAEGEAQWLLEEFEKDKRDSGMGLGEVDEGVLVEKLQPEDEEKEELQITRYDGIRSYKLIGGGLAQPRRGLRIIVEDDEDDEEMVSVRRFHKGG